MTLKICQHSDPFQYVTCFLVQLWQLASFSFLATGRECEFLASQSQVTNSRLNRTCFLFTVYFYSTRFFFFFFLSLASCCDENDLDCCPLRFPSVALSLLQCNVRHYCSIRPIFSSLFFFFFFFTGAKLISPKLTQGEFGRTQNTHTADTGLCDSDQIGAKFDLCRKVFQF